MILPSTYFPTHGENRLANEGGVEVARELFLKHRPRNLEFLLDKRYGWMNAYLKPGQRVVEFGAGSGFGREFIRHDNYVLTDVEKRPWIDEVADAMDPPYADGSIDVAICSHMIHHLSNPMRFFEAIHPKLKPGGLILIQDLNTCFLLRLALRVTRHEGWSYATDVFDRNAIANDPRDPWSANCAIPQLLFSDEAAFRANVPGFAIEKNELNECFVFLVSGGVVVQAKTRQLPRAVLKSIDAVDKVLVKLLPSVFAMGRSVVLRSVAKT